MLLSSPLHTTRQATHAVLDASAIRAQHSRLVLNLLWKDREMSRAELARRTSLSRSTVSAIVNDLLSTGLVKEARAGISSGGRRPIMLEFQDQSSFIVGIELGATHISCVLTDLRCKVRASWSAPAPVRDEPEVALKKMTMAVRSVLEADGVQASQLLGIGVAVPSPVDNERPGELLPLVVPNGRATTSLPTSRKASSDPCSSTTTPTSEPWPSFGGAPVPPQEISRTSRSPPESVPA